MRDTLTALAGIVILILVAALAAPPFVDWAGQRAVIDRTIAGSLGLPAQSEGRIEVRLLPSPRLRLDRLLLGGDSGKPSLDVRFVKAEVALAPLLKGELRFTETRIGRAELKLPVTESDAVLLPPDLSRTLGERDLVIEDLHVQQFLLTTQVPATGRTDQILADNLRLKAPSLAGPWQAEGASGGIPFRVATSALGPDGAMTLKVSGGGDSRPRFEADARIALKPLDPGAIGTGGSRAMIAEAEGTARLVVGPPVQAAGAFLPFSLGGKFKARGPIARFEAVSAEIDPGGQAARLTGSGRIDLRSWRAALSLESRRLNLDGLIYSTAGQAFLRRGGPSLGASLPVMLDLDVKAESLAFGFEEWSDLRFTGTFDRTAGLVLRRFAGTAPGAAKIEASGEIDLAPSPRFGGHLDLDAANSDGFGRYLRKLGLEGPALALLDGRPVQAASDLSAAGDDLSLRNLRLTLGEAKLTGNARYLKAEPGGRARFDAQINAQGLDIAELPPLGGLLGQLDRHDIGLKIRARDVRYGPAGARSGNGTIAASIQSDGASLVVDSLDIADLAGANATLSGRIASDGAGRITGHVAAPVAAPLLALLDRVWIAQARLVPRFVREGPLDLDVSLERDAGQADTLRSTAKGSVAGSTLDLSLLTRAGRIDALDLSLAAARAGRWFGRDDIAALRQPATLTLSGKSAKSDPDGLARLDLSATGSIAGLSLSTPKPLALGADAGTPESGTLRIATADLAPVLALAGSAAPPGAPLPADLTIALSRKGPDAHAEITGRVAEAPFSASLDGSAEDAIAGRVALGRLSLPALAAALVLPTKDPAAGSDAGWTSARFSPVPPHPRAELSVDVEQLALGRGLEARRASFGLSLDGDTLMLRDLSGSLAGGRVGGTATLTRQGGAATISGQGELRDVALSDLAGAGPVRGRLSGALRYSATGDSAAALLANLGGSGEIALADLSVPGADPAAIERTLARALVEDDPLREGRLQSVLSEEFAAGPVSAKGPVAAPVSLVGGTLRSGPIGLDLGPSRWSGTVAFDLRRQRLDARGTLTATASPKGWTGAKPSVQLGFSGPLGAPQRESDAGALSNGLAALVLQRELEKIELFDADQTERLRRRARIDMDRARAAALKAAADKAAAEKAAADEAARAARARAQQAAAEEAARQARDRRDADDPLRRDRSDPTGAPTSETAPTQTRPQP